MGTWKGQPVAGGLGEGQGDGGGEEVQGDLAAPTAGRQLRQRSANAFVNVSRSKVDSSAKNFILETSTPDYYSHYFTAKKNGTSYYRSLYIVPSRIARSNT